MPEPGSPMEIVFVLVWKMRQNIEFHKSRSLMQALLSQKGADDRTIMQAFDLFFSEDMTDGRRIISKLREQCCLKINAPPQAIRLHLQSVGIFCQDGPGGITEPCPIKEHVVI